VLAEIGAGRSTQGERERLRSRRCPEISEGLAAMVTEARSDNGRSRGWYQEGEEHGGHALHGRTNDPAIRCGTEYHPCPRATQ